MGSESHTKEPPFNRCRPNMVMGRNTKSFTPRPIAASSYSPAMITHTKENQNIMRASGKSVRSTWCPKR